MDYSYFDLGSGLVHLPYVYWSLKPGRSVLLLEMPWNFWKCLGGTIVSFCLKTSIVSNLVFLFCCSSLVS
jgi:hypothetical protein